MTLHLDLETCSTVDLRRTGVHRYAEDPNTHVICACYRLTRSPAGRVGVWQPGHDVPDEIMEAISNGERIAAWNAQFEATLWEHVLAPRHGWPMPPFDQFECSMARAMYWGLPAALGDAGEALDLQITKDRQAHSLMMRMARPRAVDEDGTIHWWHEEDAQKLADEIAYCQRDVLSEEAIHHALPPLPDMERKLWLLDQKMNRKGLGVDRDLVKNMRLVVKAAERDLKEKMQEVTGGAVSGPNATAALAKWLVDQGLQLPDLKADTLRSAVKAMPDSPAKDAIQLRLDGAKASVAKLNAFEDAVCTDGNVRGLIRYYGASRTGRFSGAGGAKVQPHNLVRGTIKDVKRAIKLLQFGVSPAELEMLFEDSAMGVVASCLRGVFVP